MTMRSRSPRETDPVLAGAANQVLAAGYRREQDRAEAAQVLRDMETLRAW